MKNIYIWLDEFTIDIEPKNNALTYNQLILAIKEKRPTINTPLTSAFNLHYLSFGYEITVFSKDGFVVLNNLLSNGDIRPSQNAEKMLLSGCFGLVETEELS